MKLRFLDTMDEREIVDRIAHVMNHPDLMSIDGDERLNTEENEIVDWRATVDSSPSLHENDDEPGHLPLGV